ncbi:hypothetical protein [Pseudomonas sp. NPDC007930]|uniref:PA0061/PA0062 family lipoprotein n=1 Tax=Pseudomonas sp. NPDC007930 TaxID=3364417 RepID=UPI0036E0BAEC
MTLTTLRTLTPTLLLCGLLSACATPLPNPPAGDAFVKVAETTTLDQVLGEKVDGHTTADARYFELKPGNHDLAVLIEQEGYNDEDQDCYADFKYSGFKAGHHYTIDESSLGDQVTAVLKNDQGKVVSRAVNMDCMPG